MSFSLHYARCNINKLENQRIIMDYEKDFESAASIRIMSMNYLYTH